MSRIEGIRVAETLSHISQTVRKEDQRTIHSHRLQMTDQQRKSAIERQQFVKGILTNLR